MGLAAAEELREQPPEVPVDRAERFEHPLPPLAVEAGDAASQARDRLQQIGAGLLHLPDTLVELARFRLCPQVHGADVLSFADQPLKLDLHRFGIGKRTLGVEGGNRVRFFRRDAETFRDLGSGQGLRLPGLGHEALEPGCALARFAQCRLGLLERTRPRPSLPVRRPPAHRRHRGARSARSRSCRAIERARASSSAGRASRAARALSASPRRSASAFKRRRALSARDAQLSLSCASSAIRAPRPAAA